MPLVDGTDDGFENIISIDDRSTFRPVWLGINDIAKIGMILGKVII